MLKFDMPVSVPSLLQGSNPISQERLEEAVRVIISYQNRDGGMATYENTRSFHAMEVSP
jgi:hypothetical protein